MEEQKASRAINRHMYSLEEAEAAVQKPVVRALLQLMRFRNTHPAFNGQVRPSGFTVTSYTCPRCFYSAARSIVHYTLPAAASRRYLSNLLMAC